MAISGVDARGVQPDPEPSLRAWDCSTPTQSRILDSGTVCEAGQDNAAGVNRRIQVIQVQSQYRLPGYKCKLSESLHVSYCGISSYTQAIPFGYTMRPKKLTREECRRAVRDRKYKTPTGESHEVQIPGFTSFKVQVAGLETLTEGVLHCQGETMRVNGRYLKNIVAEAELHLTIEEETFEISQERVTVIRDQTQVDCALGALGCAGSLATYIWPAKPAPCSYRHVTNAQGAWDESRRRFRGNTPQITFDVAEHNVALPANCPGAGKLLYRTQFDALMVYIDEGTLALPTIDEGVDWSLQGAVTEDRLSRLSAHVTATLGDTSTWAVCKQTEAGLGKELQPTGYPGRFAVRAGSAILELTCQTEVVTADMAESRCYNLLPVKTRTGDRRYVDLARQLILEVATELKCRETSAQYFADIEGRWFKKTATVKRVSAPLARGFQLTHAEEHPLVKDLNLYTDAELETFREITLYPATRHQVMSALFDGLCAEEGACPVRTGGGGGPVYSLKHLEEGVESAMGTWMPSWWSTLSAIWSASTVVGHIGGLLAVAAIAIQAVRCCYAAGLNKWYRCCQVQENRRSRVRRRSPSEEEHEMDRLEEA